MAMAEGSATSGQLELGFDAPLEVQRWRVIGNPIMAIPHYVVLYVLSAVAGVLWFVSAIMILISGKYSEGIAKFQVMVQRYTWRVWTFAPFLREPYPPFTFGQTYEDPGDDPSARYSIVPTLEIPRWEPLYRWILAIPAAIVLFFFAIGAYIFMIIGFFQVLFTGAWSQSGRDFVLRVNRQGMRLSAYIYFLTNTKPETVPPA